MEKTKTKRIHLSTSQREIVFNKTGGHCHICGCELEKGWVADHIVPHVFGGECIIENFLPACRECNRLKWFYKKQELQKILRLGIYCNEEIRKGKSLGIEIKKLYDNKLVKNEKRTKKATSDNTITKNNEKEK